MSHAKHGGNKKSANNDRKVKSFERRYKMTRADWRELKKKSPQEANQLRLKALTK
jgi:hypothetical protein